VCWPPRPSCCMLSYSSSRGSCSPYRYAPLLPSSCLPLAFLLPLLPPSTHIAALAAALAGDVNHVLPPQASQFVELGLAQRTDNGITSAGNVFGTSMFVCVCVCVCVCVYARPTMASLAFLPCSSPLLLCPTPSAASFVHGLTVPRAPQGVSSSWAAFLACGLSSTSRPLKRSVGSTSPIYLIITTDPSFILLCSSCPPETRV
jgi:hypothetical protein